MSIIIVLIAWVALGRPTEASLAANIGLVHEYIVLIATAWVALGRPTDVSLLT